MKDKEHDKILSILKDEIICAGDEMIGWDEATKKILNMINKDYVSKHEILAKLNNKKARVDIELQFKDPSDRQFYINALDMVLRILNVSDLEKELSKEKQNRNDLPK